MMDSETVLREEVDKIAAELNYDKYEVKVQPISTEGANYTTQLYTATVSAPGKPDLELFGKIATLTESMRALIPISVYAREIFFYTELLNKYKDLEEEHNIPEKHRLLTPKYYGSNKEYMKESVIIENLTQKDFKLYDRLKSMDWKFAEKAVEQLAKLHALSIAYAENYPEEFEKLSSSFKLTVFSIERNDLMETMINSVIEGVSEEYRERFSMFVKKYMNPETMEKFFAPFRRAVLAHGDYRTSNLMYRVVENGELEIAVLDFQTIQASNPITDLLYFIFNGSDESFREQHYHQLLDHYHSELSLSLTRLGLDPDKLYSKEDFQEDLKNVLPFGLVIIIFTLPIVTVEADHAPQLATDMSIKLSSLFSERINGIIKDFIEMGVL